MIASDLQFNDIKNHLNCILLLPIGSLEQHGPYLPLSTDKIIAEELCLSVEEEMKNKVMLLPTIPFGLSLEHEGFTGNISLNYKTLFKIIEEISNSFAEYGFKKMIIVNGHGGNKNLIELFREIYNRSHDLKIKQFYTSSKNIITNSKDFLDKKSFGHAGSAESSLITYLIKKNNFPKKIINKEIYKGNFDLYKTREISQSGIISRESNIYFSNNNGEKLFFVMKNLLNKKIKAFLE